MDERDRYEAGLKVRRAVLGDAHVDRSLGRRNSFNEEFQELITRYAWGEIWTRPGLDRKTSSCRTCAPAQIPACAKIEGLAGSNPSFAAWEQNEPYTIALLIKGRSGGASTKHLYRSGSSSTGDHILFLTSGTAPNLRHQASGGGTVTITSSSRS